jgi:hypothetical protein
LKPRYGSSELVFEFVGDEHSQLGAEPCAEALASEHVDFVDRGLREAARVFAFSITVALLVLGFSAVSASCSSSSRDVVSGFLIDVGDVA